MTSLRVMVNKEYLPGTLDEPKDVTDTQISINTSSFYSQWINHPSYSSSTQNNDFAIIKLGSPVVFSERVSPVCLPSASTNYDARVATVTGWGTLSSGGSQPDILQKVVLTLSSYSHPPGCSSS